MQCYSLSKAASMVSWVLGILAQRSRGVKKFAELLTFLLKIVISCLPAASKASMTSRATSVGHMKLE